MKREDEFKKVLEKCIKDDTFLTLGHEGTIDFYVGIIASSLAAIADELHEMNNPEERKDDHYELMKLKSEIFEYIDNRILSLKNNLEDMRSVCCSTDETIVKELARTRNHIDKIFYDYIHMVPEEDEE